MKVLIVDDSRMYLAMLDSYVQAMGHETILANNGKDGIAAYHQDQPDLILLDVSMPDMDGYEVARQINACQNRIWVPIIFLSALIEDKDILRGIEAGGDDYITKPESQVMIQAKVQAMQRIAKMSQKLIQTGEALQEANKKLHSISMKDALTGIANRRCYDLVVHKEWHRAMRQQHMLSVMLIDIDHFKLYNDEYGHQQGDTCLKQVARQLQQRCKRATDLVARYGGEEFVIVLPGCDQTSSQQLGQRLCKYIQSLNIPHRTSSVAREVTISIGVASTIPQQGEAAEDFIQAVDQALYQAKGNGRNQVCLSSYAM